MIRLSLEMALVISQVAMGAAAIGSLIFFAGTKLLAFSVT
jgi:hypothetical protein